MSTQSPRPFDLVCENLRKIGAIPLHEYLASIKHLDGSAAPFDEEERVSTNSSNQNEDIQDLEREDHGHEPVKDSSGNETFEEESDPCAAQIERLYRDWRPQHPPPEWILYSTTATDEPLRWGAALRVCLVEPKLYSTDVMYSTMHEAKAACAQAALNEGVLSFIQDNKSSSNSPDIEPEHLPKRIAPMTLHAWYDTLPRPLPAFFGTKHPNEIGAPAFLNDCTTKVRGARLKTTYFWPINNPPGLYSCLLRIDRPTTEYRSYLVEPVFTNRAEAKTAVCLLAIAQGAEEFLKAIGDKIQNKITPKLRAFAHEQIFPLLAQKAPGDAHDWTFQTERDAFGCSLTVYMGSEEHKYVAEPDYRTKADAKIAAAASAAEHGLPELLRFRGETPPPGYQTLWDVFQNHANTPVAPATNLKRKHGEVHHATDSDSGKKVKKRKKKATKREEGEITPDPGQQPKANNDWELLPRDLSGAPLHHKSGSMPLTEKSLTHRPPARGVRSSTSGGVPLSVTKPPRPNPTSLPRKPQTNPPNHAGGPSQPGIFYSRPPAAHDALNSSYRTLPSRPSFDSLYQQYRPYEPQHYPRRPTDSPFQ